MHTRAVLLLLLCTLVGSNAKFICRSRSCGLLNTTFLDEASNIQSGPSITLTAVPDTVVLGDTVSLQTTSSPPGFDVCSFDIQNSAGEFVPIECGGNINTTTQCDWPVITTNVRAVFRAGCSNGSIDIISNDATVSVLKPQLTLSSSTNKQIIGEVITLTATASVPQDEGRLETQPLSGREITFTVTGSGTLSLPPQNLTSSGGGTRPQPPARGKALTNELTTATDDSGSATAQLIGTAPGELFVSVVLQTGAVRTKSGLGPIHITGNPVTPLVASVSLNPTLSEAHLGEPVSLTATALDAEGNPFPGAKVCLLSAGRAQLEYYYPHSQPQHPVKSLCGVTDTQGKVTLSFTSKIPGTVGVVAAALQSGRGSVVSAPSHVMFWGQEHPQDHHTDRSEGWWRVEEYGAAATKLAIATLTPATRALP